MTEQLVIKLNKEQFEPILNSINKKIHHLAGSNSEMTALCVLGMHRLCFEKIPELENTTSLEYILKKRGITFEQCVFEMLNKKKEILNK